MKIKYLSIFFIVFSLSAVAQDGSGDGTGYDPITNPQPWVRPLDRMGVHLGFPLATVTRMLTGEDTGGLFEGSIEHIETDYYGPAHYHEESDETIIMIDGSANLRLNGRDFTLTRGEWLHIPRGTIHSFKSTGNPAKWIILKSPPAPPPRPVTTPDCDRSTFTPEMNADPVRMNQWYNDCLDDFYMAADADIPGTPYTPSSYKPPFEVRPWVRPLDRQHFHLGFPASSVTPMLSGEDTDGAFTASVEHIEDDYYGPPHMHYTKTETLIILEGSTRLRVSGTDFTLTEGQWLHIPAGNVHSITSTGSPARFIILQTPGIGAVVDAEVSEACDRSDFTPEMNRDPEIMIPWYQECAYDFYMVPEAGLPGDVGDANESGD